VREGFEEFVAVAWPRLLRSAWLLTGDWHRAEDLVQTVLAKTYGRWGQIRNGTPDAYLRKAMAMTYLSWRRWRGEIASAEQPESASDDLYAGVELRDGLATALAQLPRQQRAVLMLRFPRRPQRRGDGRGAGPQRRHGQVAHQSRPGGTAAQLRGIGPA
jgi:DNA-directed RNA polymerase specialized sigma24 family protein